MEIGETVDFDFEHVLTGDLRSYQATVKRVGNPCILVPNYPGSPTYFVYESGWVMLQSRNVPRVVVDGFGRGAEIREHNHNGTQQESTP